jgi:DNA topoisomerase IA
LDEAKKKDAAEFFFQANGSRVLFDGWLKADPAARGEDVELPEVKEGETLKVNDVHLKKNKPLRPSATPKQAYSKNLKSAVSAAHQPTRLLCARSTTAAT